MEQSVFEHLGKSHTGKDGINVAGDKVFSYPSHTHAYYEMTLYEPFDGSITLNGKAFCICEPSVVLVTPSDIHRIDVGGNAGNFIKVAFDESIIRERCPAVRLPLKCDAPESGFVTGLFHELLHSEDPLYSANLVCTAVSYLWVNGVVLPGMGVGNTSKKELLSAAIRLMNREFCEDITLKGVADRIGVSPQYLSKVFSEVAGVSFCGYLCGLRLRYASQLIGEGRMSITEVCFACGYRNLSHFIRSFKRQYGISPGKWQR